MEGQMAKAAVVEDDENIQKLITYSLSTNSHEARGYSSGADFLNDIESFRPDIVLLDVMMPGMDGIEVLRRLRRADRYHDFACVPVMMLTAKSGEVDKVKALDLGADDYMTKPFGVMEMLSRVRALLRRAGSKLEMENGPERKAPICFHEISLDENRHVTQVGGEAVELTLKEFDLLSYLMRNQGLVLTRDQIMQNVWNYDYEGESRTVDMHIKSLRKKLGDAGQYIVTVRGVGYKLSEG